MQTAGRWAGSTLRQPTPSRHGLACWKALPDLIQNPLAIDTWGPLPPPGKLLGPCLHLRPSAPLYLFLAALCLGTSGQFLSSRTAALAHSVLQASPIPQNIPFPSTPTLMLSRDESTRSLLLVDLPVWRGGRAVDKCCPCQGPQWETGRSEGDLNNLHTETRGRAKNGERERIAKIRCCLFEIYSVKPESVSHFPQDEGLEQWSHCRVTEK